MRMRQFRKCAVEGAYIYMYMHILCMRSNSGAQRTERHQQKESERDEEQLVRVLWIEGWARQGDGCMYAILSLFVRHGFI